MIASFVFAAALAQDARTAVDAHGIVFVPQNGELVEPLATYRPTRPCTYPASGGAFVERAEAPLVMRWRQEDGSIVEETGLDDLTAVNLGFQFACHPIVNFGLSGPIYLGYTTESGHQGPVQGDPRVIGAITAPTDNDEPLRWALVGFLDFPFGPPADHVGRYRVSGGLVSAWSWTDGGPWSIATNLGAQILPRARFADVRGGPQVLWSFAAGRTVTPWLGVGGELQTRAVLASSSVLTTRLPTEALLHARLRWREWPWITAGAAAAVLPGPGAARYRLFVGTGIGDRRNDLQQQRGPIRGNDPDHDGLTDELCPEAAEIVNGWKDDDGCPDGLATLTVRVVDRDTGEVVKATVTVAGVTREGANMQLIGLMPGDATLDVVAEGYAPFTLPIRLAEGSATQAVYLQRAP